MPIKTVYILHKNGANNHYIALASLLKQHNVTIKYREFSVLSTLFKAIITLDFNLLKKQIINFFFLTSLLYSKDRKIILGIAPFDSKLSKLLFILKKHKIYYHTSWTCWDKSFHPKTKKNTVKVFSTWENFIENIVIHIFSVTKKSKNQLLNNYTISEKKISVVYHAINKDFFIQTGIKKKPNSFIYYGRLVPQKGIRELVTFFSKNTEGTLTIIGDGKEKNTVLKFANEYKNINYIAHISNKQDLIEEISKHQYLALNSIRNKKWEELFGLVIIECMAQGVIPIATNHSGPKEIISKDVGYLCKEGDMLSIISKIIKRNYFDKTMSIKAKEKANLYLTESIAKKWQAILY